MKFGIAIPQFYADGEFDPAAFRRYFQRAEELGYHSAWALEGTLNSGAQLAPLETMTYAAACSTRLRLGCVVFVSTLHSPVHLAKSLSTLDQLSGGRVDIGVGTGGPNRPFAAFGVDPARYLARFTEGVAFMKDLWTQQKVTFEGDFWQLKDGAMEPKPVQKPYPPLWFGGAAPAALRRAVHLGDGFFGAGSSTTQAFAEQVKTIKAELNGRTGFQLAKRLYIEIDDNAERARDNVNEGLRRIYGRRVESIEAAAAAGTVDDCVRAAREIAAAGAELILFTALNNPVEHAERIAAEVIPRLA